MAEERGGAEWDGDVAERTEPAEPAGWTSETP